MENLIEIEKRVVPVGEREMTNYASVWEWIESDAREEGREEGQEETTCSIVKRLIANGVTDSVILKATDITAAELAEFKVKD